MLRPIFRPEFEGIRAFTPVRSAVAEPHLLGANESPHRPIPEVCRAIAEAALDVNRYPDLTGSELIAELSQVLRVPEEGVLVGAGSVALLQQLFQSIALPQARVVYGWRSFELYPTLADLAGVVGVQVALRDHVHDLAAIEEAVNPHTRMVIVCNPNNPTGTLLGSYEIRGLLDALPGDCLVALDEAYFEYVRAPDAGDSLELIREYPNLVVLRTFSKAFGLAGLRVGYLVGSPAVVAQVRKAFVPFSVSTVAQAAALAALRAKSVLMARVDETVAERERILQQLRAAGCQVPISHANFIWLPIGDKADGFRDHAARGGVAVRCFPGEGVRVSVGTVESNDIFLECALESGLLRGAS